MAQTLSIKPLTTALQNPDLSLAQDDAKLIAARKAVTDALLNQPSKDELAGFNNRLKLLSEHRQTRLGRLFFTALEAAPGIENLPLDASEAGVAAYFPLALGSGIQVRASWQRAGDTMKISQFSVSITGNAGAFLTAGGPYFGSGTPDPKSLDAIELDFLLGRDPADLMKLESERGTFDFGAALKKRFEVKTGEAAARLKALDTDLAKGKDSKEKAAALGRHLTTAEKKLLELSAPDPKFWARIKAQVAALSAMAAPDSIPVFDGSSVTVLQATPRGTSEWMLRRIDGALALSGAGLGLVDETGE